jgi:ATP-dependent helicase HepA
LFVLSGKADKQMQLDRFLPPTPIKISVDTNNLQSDKHFVRLAPVSPKMGNQLVKALQAKLLVALESAQQFAEQSAMTIRQQCQQNLQELLGEELERLTNLQKVNPSIRDEEIEHLERQLTSLKAVISDARISLEAVRLVVNNP